MLHLLRAFLTVLNLVKELYLPQTVSHFRSNDLQQPQYVQKDTHHLIKPFFASSPQKATFVLFCPNFVQECRLVKFKNAFFEFLSPQIHSNFAFSGKIAVFQILAISTSTFTYFCDSEENL